MKGKGGDSRVTKTECRIQRYFSGLLCVVECVGVSKEGVATLTIVKGGIFF